MAVNQSILIASADLTERVRLDGSSFQNIYLCHHNTCGQVVLKTVYTGICSRKSKTSLLEEAEVLHKLSHSRIVRLLGVVLEDGAYSLALEFVPKGNLRAMLYNVTVPASIQGRIILEILEGMVFLTRNGVTHKDLNPENVLVDRDFHMKIAGTCLSVCPAWSKLTREESRRQSKKGVARAAVPLSYLAPEHLRNINTPFTEKSDVFSFAIVIWTVLTGKVPYEGQRESGVCAGNRPDEQLIPPATPLMILWLMRECWRQDPSKRPTFAESYKSFQRFYSDELEKNADKDLQNLKGVYEGPEEFVKRMSSLRLSEPHSKTGSVTLQTDAILALPDRDPPGRFICSPDLTNPIPNPNPNPIPNPNPPVLRQTWSNPGSSDQRTEEAPPAPRPDFGTPTPTPGAQHRASCPVYRSCPGQQHQHQHQQQHQLKHQHQHQLKQEAGTDSLAAGAWGSAAGVYIQNATGVQIGDNNRLTYGGQDPCEDGFQPSAPDTSVFKDLLQKHGDRAVSSDQLELLSMSIGKRWKSCARSLGLTDTDVETIAYNWAHEGLTEMGHQALRAWQMKQGLVGSTAGALCRALRHCVRLDLLCQLLEMGEGAESL